MHAQNRIRNPVFEVPPDNLLLLASSGEPRVGRAMVALLSATKYLTPVTLDGTPVRGFPTVTFNFVP